MSSKNKNRATNAPVVNTVVTETVEVVTVETPSAEALEINDLHEEVINEIADLGLSVEEVPVVKEEATEEILGAPSDEVIIIPAATATPEAEGIPLVDATKVVILPKKEKEATGTAKEKKVAEPQVVIIKATYGKDKDTIECAENIKIGRKVTNKLCGKDPAFKKVKTLVLVAEFNGVKRKYEFTENEFIEIDKNDFKESNLTEDELTALGIAIAQVEAPAPVVETPATEELVLTDSPVDELVLSPVNEEEI